jgi:hypothetical protein
VHRREEYERAISDKHIELENIIHDQERLVVTLQSLQSDQERYAEENRVLKKAVHIQHQKLEGERYELHKAQEMLECASDQMRRQERTIEALRAQLEMFNCPQPMVQIRRPPDVY